MSTLPADPDYILVCVSVGFPAIVAFYDHNGQLVTTMNNHRGMPGAPIRLISPAPIMFNPGPNNNQQPQQGKPYLLNFLPLARSSF